MPDSQGDVQHGQTQPPFFNQQGILEKQMIQKRINTVYFLVSRERGNQITRTRMTTTFLPFSLVARWTLASKIEIVNDAKTLLGRTLDPWEESTLIFLQKNLVATRQPWGNRGIRKEALQCMSHDILSIVPITFLEIIQNLIETGADLNWRDFLGFDLFHHLIKLDLLNDRSVDFFESVIRHGYYNVQEIGDEVIRFICSSCATSVSYAKARMIKFIFDCGIELREETKQNLVKVFISASLSQLNRNAARILMLLLRHGCRANEALFAFELLKPTTADHVPVYFDFILLIANILIDHGAQVTREYRSPEFLFKMLAMVNSGTRHSSMLDFLKKCIRAGYDINGTSVDGTNILMAFCAHYKCDDLASVVQYLCLKGIDVGALDKHERSALFYLADNRPFFEKRVHDAIRVLFEFGIDTGHTDLSGCTALAKFLAIDVNTRCCYYTGLKSSNETYYWQTLNLLLDVGFEVATEEGAFDVLQRFLTKFTELMFKNGSICASCSQRASLSEDAAVNALGSHLFEEAFNLIERLVIAAGARINATFLDDFENVLHYVCFFFRGEQLVSLVKLLCEHGVDVNATANTFLGKDPSKSTKATDVLRKFNVDQEHLVDRLVGIMEPFGYQEDA